MNGLASEESAYSKLNKTIWILWFQGETNMPVIPKKCYQSWIHFNPEWNIVLLHSDNLSEYCSDELNNLLAQKNITLQAKSDILRINLLNTFGGVWVDSTCFCVKPLKEWLPKQIESGFFAFAYPEHRNTMIASWFLVGLPGNHLLNAYCDATNSYWQDNPKIRLWSKSRLIRYSFKLLRLNKYLDRKAQKWSNKFFLKILKVHPYYWFHHLFEKVYLEDKQSRLIWDDTPKRSSVLAHNIQYGKDALSDDLKDEIAKRTIPVYKLNWRVDLSKRVSAQYLFSKFNFDEEIQDN